MNNFFLFLKKYKKPWGYYKILYKNKNFLVKLLNFKPNSQTSYQYHNFRKEIWIVVGWKGKAIINDKEIDLDIGKIIIINEKEKHQIINNSNKELKIIEIWLGEKLDENDIVRIKDIYGRV